MGRRDQLVEADRWLQQLRKTNRFGFTLLWLGLSLMLFWLVSSILDFLNILDGE